MYLIVRPHIKWRAEGNYDLMFSYLIVTEEGAGQGLAGLRRGGFGWIRF